MPSKIGLMIEDRHILDFKTKKKGFITIGRWISGLAKWGGGSGG